MAYRQWQRLHGTRDPGLRHHSQSRPLLHSHSKPGIEWHLRELRQNLQARLCSREPSSGCDHRTPADRRMVLGLQRKPSPFWAQNALPKGVHASSITIALCPVKRGQLQAQAPAMKSAIALMPMAIIALVMTKAHSAATTTKRQAMMMIAGWAGRRCSGVGRIVPSNG